MFKVKAQTSIIIFMSLIFLTASILADVVKNDLSPITKINLDHERYNDVPIAGPTQPSYKKPASAFRKIDNPPALPDPPYDYFCDYENYTNGTPYYAWPLPDAYGDNYFNMRFTSEYDYNCTLLTAHFLLYALYQTGDPDIRIYLWDDDGFGFPLNKIDSIDILDPGAGLEGTNTFYWVSADFSFGNYVFSDGDEYHLGFTTIINTPGDTLLIISDDGTGPYSGEERASELFNGIWGTMLNDWGMDISFFIEAERCCAQIPFSDCRTLSYIQNLTYHWKAPNPTYGDSAYAQKFTFGGIDTLVYVDFAVYDDAGQPGATGIFGNNDIYISVYDDLYGTPNNLIISDTVPAGSYAAFPSITTAYFNNYVLDQGTYHIAFSTNAVFGSGDYESILSSDGTDGVGGSSSIVGGVWQNMFVSWGMDVNFYIEPYVCNDPTVCDIEYCYNGLGYLWRLPDQYGDVGQAQNFTAGYSSDCRIQEVDILFYWSGISGYPTQYTYNTDISICPDMAGLPGPPIATKTLTPSDYAAWGLTAPGVNGVWITVDFTDMAYLPGNYWVTVNSLAPTPETGIRVVSDAGSGPCLDTWAEDYGGGNWHLMTDGWGVGHEWAMVMEAEHCCIPYYHPCHGYAEDWSTYQGNFYRSGRSYVTMGDTKCDLRLDWSFSHPTNGISFTGPVTYYDRVVCSFAEEYQVFDFDGIHLYTYVPQAGPFPPGDIRCAPTVTMIQGYPYPVMFVSGGSNQEIHAVDFNTGNLIWSRDINSVGTGGMFGNTRWGVFTLLDINGADAVFWGTDDGMVVGVDALTGNLLPGYPVDLSQSTWISGTTDGTNLFYTTRSTAVEGDVYSIDAATGTINWQLSATDGLQGQNIFTHTNGYFGDEGFTGGISYDLDYGRLYCNSRAEADHPTDGIFYGIQASNGSIAVAAATNRVLYSTPIIDRNRVLMTSFTRWASPPAGGDVFYINKYTGVIEVAVPGGPAAFPYYNNGALSCEASPDNDQYYVFTYDGFLQCLDANNGDELWRRRAESGPGYLNRGMAGALTVDTDDNPYLFYGDLAGNLYCFSKGNDRPRLEIQSYQPSVPVEFGSATNYPVFINNIFANTGCTPLGFTEVNVDSESFGVDVPSFTATRVNSDFMNRANKIADRLTRDAFLSKYIRPSEISTNENSLIDNTVYNKHNNSIAAGFPTFLNSVVYPAVGTIINPDDTIGLELDVIQANINRGPQSFYVQLCTNDPDFFINDPALCPEIYVTLVGGCLADTSTLYFGVGGINEHLASNTGRLGTGDWGDGPAGYNCFYIDGDGASYYQGAYAYGISQHEIATNSQDWSSGGGEIDAFISLQPDPNWCDNDCKPFLDAGVTLGYITNDGGLSYNPILGNMVCKSFIDSVQNFDLGGGWDWENFGAPFDNSLTMGIYTEGRIVGAIDVPSLHNVTVEIMEFTERNGDPINDWYLMEYWDCDNGNDTVAIDRSISSAWAYNPANGQAWGQIKIPFGCGHDPIINTVGLYGASGNPGFGFWGWGIFWDSAYGYMSGSANPPSGVDPGHFSYDMSTSDGEAMVTLASHNFAGSDSYEIGIAHFGQLYFNNPEDGTELAPLALLVNQWCGFGRGDGNNDGEITLADIIYIADAANGGPGGVPFAHLLDVNADGNVDNADALYMIDFYFNGGPCPVGDWVF